MNPLLLFSLISLVFTSDPFTQFASDLDFLRQCLGTAYDDYTFTMQGSEFLQVVRTDGLEIQSQTDHALEVCLSSVNTTLTIEYSKVEVWDCDCCSDHDYFPGPFGSYQKNKDGHFGLSFFDIETKLITP